MNERLLQFIWQHSLYQPGSLTTTEGETVTVVHPGLFNTNAGPDFLEAKIRVGKTLLAGHVEMHVVTSDWHRHGHEHDEKYKNIVLHVVYQNDNGKSAANTPILELKKHIPKEVINSYSSLVQAPSGIPCSNHLQSIKSITKESWLTRMLAERWEEKLTDWKELLDSSAGDWSNLMYWRTAANFGFKVNAAPFLMLARSLPLNILAKHREDLMQVEALLFGQAGMLNEKFKEKYPNVLKNEYEYLAKKYKLQPIPVHHWKFLRLRPANFPTVRIAQFAALAHQSVHLFSKIVELHSIKEIIPLLDVTASEYWNTHYQFGEPQDKASKKHLGTSSIHNIIINTIAPIQFLYASQQETTKQQEKALQLLEDLPVEKNAILERWNDNGWKAENGAQSQSLIQLYNNYCSSKRCLDCSIGLSIFKSAPGK